MMSGRVVVLGSVNVDLMASVDRLPVAGETVSGHRLVRQLGGKGANQAVAAARAGVTSVLLAAVGNDGDGAAMIETLADFGVDVTAIERVPRETGHALVVTSPCDNQIVVVPGANALVDSRLASLARWSPNDVALTQLETPIGAAAALFERARGSGARTILNAAPASESVCVLLPLTDILIVNESELELLSGDAICSEPDDTALLAACASQRLSAVCTVIVTLGAAGVAVIREQELWRVRGIPATVVDTTGAGDCFCGYMAAALARGDALETAVVEANVAASVAVQSLGAAGSIPPRSQIASAALAAQTGV